MIDFESLLKKIEDSYAMNLPFVAYREPNQNLVKALLQADDHLHEMHEYDKSGFVFAPFDNREKSILIPMESSLHVEANLPFINMPDEDLSDDVPAEVAKQTHINLVNKGIEFIKMKGAEKIVLSRKEEISIPSFAPVITFKKLLDTYQSAFVYLWYHPKKGLWLGATPEKLITLKGNEFQTVSLAGTQSYKGLNDVEWGEKELREQQIVTQYITSGLASLANDVVVSELKTVKAGNLLHLSTNITGTLKSGNDLDIAVSQLHPTPAICGMPKISAKTFILENEGYNREFYTGFLGELHMNSSSNLFVNLRCMKADNSTMTLFLGGGITLESIAEKEWQETVEKSQTMKRVLRN